MNKAKTFLGLSLTALSLTVFTSSAAAFNILGFKNGTLQSSVPVFFMVNLQMGEEIESFLVAEEFFQCEFKNGDSVNFQIKGDMKEYRKLKKSISENGNWWNQALSALNDDFKKQNQIEPGNVIVRVQGCYNKYNEVRDELNREIKKYE